MKKGNINLNLGEELPQPFTTKENFEYAIKYVNGDNSAREELIIHNLRMVVNIANRYYSNIKCDYQDLMFAGIEGLIASIDKYDPSYNVPFYSFAKKGIMNNITLFLRNELNLLFGGEIVSLYEPVTCDNQGNSYERIDILETNEELLEDQVIDKMIANEIKKFIYELPEYYKMPVILYYGLEGYIPHTQTEISKIIGISRQQTNKRIKTATNMIRENFKFKYEDELKLEMKLS